MLSKKSYFKPALFWYDLRRFSPIWVCASLAILLIPFALWLRIADELEEFKLSITEYTSYAKIADNPICLRLNEMLLDALSAAAPILIMLYAVVPAMALLNYLYQNRSALGTHALPTTRTELFVTHYAAGIAMMVIPLIIFCIVTIPVLLVANAFWPSVLLTFCGGALGIYIFFFSFAIFCGMFTGQLWGVPLFYAIFNALATISFGVFTLLAQMFLFGFSTSSLNDAWIQHLTPLWQFTEAMHLTSINSMGTYHFEGLGTIAIYAMIGLCLAGVSCFLFQQRHLERAGEIISMRTMRPVFTLGFSIYGGFCLALFFCSILNVDITTNWMFFFLTLGTSFGFLLGQMLLEKTIAVFHKRNLKYWALTLFVTCLCFSIIRFDLLGYEDFVPEVEDVESVAVSITLYGDAITVPFHTDSPYITTDSEQIALIRDTHNAILADYALTGESFPAQETFARATAEPAEVVDTTETVTAEDASYVSRTQSFDVAYTLTTGQVVTRSYYVFLCENELLREDSPTAHLNKFAATIDLAQRLTDMREKLYVSITLHQENGDSYSTDGDMNSALALGMVDAVLADIDEQDITMGILRKDYRDITKDTADLYYRDVTANSKNGSDYLYFNFSNSFYITLLPGTNATNYALEKAG